MKLRRHQKDTSWVSERYTINNGTSVQGTVYNIPPYSTSVSIRFERVYTKVMFGQLHYFLECCIALSKIKRLKNSGLDMKWYIYNGGQLLL